MIVPKNMMALRPIMNRNLVCALLQISLGCLVAPGFAYGEVLSRTSENFKVGDIDLILTLIIENEQGTLQLSTNSSRPAALKTNFPDLRERTIYDFPISGLIQIRDAKGAIMTPGSPRLHPQWCSVRLFASDLAQQNPEPFVEKGSLSKANDFTAELAPSGRSSAFPSFPGSFAEA